MLRVEVERANKPGIGRVELSPAELATRFRRDAMR